MDSGPPTGLRKSLKFQFGIPRGIWMRSPVRFCFSSRFCWSRLLTVGRQPYRSGKVWQQRLLQNLRLMIRKVHSKISISTIRYGSEIWKCKSDAHKLFKCSSESSLSLLFPIRLESQYHWTIEGVIVKSSSGPIWIAWVPTLHKPIKQKGPDVLRKVVGGSIRMGTEYVAKLADFPER